LALTVTNQWSGYCTTLMVPMHIKVTGSDERQTRASSQPFVRANIKQLTNAPIKCTNWTTLSPIPSSSFVRSLYIYKKKDNYEKPNNISTCSCTSWL